MPKIDKLLVGLVLLVFGGVVVHAPLSVFLGTIWPELSVYIKAWKEVTLVLAFGLLLWSVWSKKLWRAYRNPLMYLVLAFVVLHFVSSAVAIGLGAVELQQAVAGLMIDLRFLLMFVLAYGVVVMYPQLRRLFLWLFVGGLVLVAGFAVLQVTVLPDDALKYIGYGEDTIQPYLTVDLNNDYVRINSTLRGPNPLGAYASVGLAVLAAGIVANPRLRRWLSVSRLRLFGCVALSVSLVVALWFSYSRSALVGLAVAGAVLFLAVYGWRLSWRIWLVVGLGLAVVLGGLYVAKDSDFVSHVIMHENPDESNDVNSNDGHWYSLMQGVGLMISQPLGAGVGSTGSAAMYGMGGPVIENYYLFVAHEAGWLGLVLFLVIFGHVSWLLWLNWLTRRDWLSLGVLAGGLGLAVVGIFLPVWSDDTVSIVWWGMAAVCVAGLYNSKKGELLWRQGGQPKNKRNS